MKKLLLFGLLGLTVAPSAPLEAAPKRRAVAALKWPAFRQNATKKSSPEVMAIQYLLRSRGFYKAPIDGVFGAQTAAAVRAFQRKNGLKADGIVASQTLPQLIVPLKRGSKGDAVRAFQTLLKNTPSPHDGDGAYADLKVDGHFGFETESYLRGYQEAVRVIRQLPFVKVDGRVGALTWCDLFGGAI